MTAIAASTIESDIAAAVGLLRGWPGVTRIWLFGSAAQGRPLDFRSDLDFAVEGLTEVQELRAWVALDDTLRLPVDLVRWERADPLLREQILAHGRLLYAT